MIDFKFLLKNKFPSLAFFTAIGYLISYYYQLSFASFYGFPEEYVFFDILTLLKSLAFMFILLALIVSMGLMLLTINQDKLVPLAVVIVMVLVIASIFGWSEIQSVFYHNAPISPITIVALIIIPGPFTFILLKPLGKKHVDNHDIGCFLVVSAMLVYLAPTMTGKLQAYANLDYFTLNGKADYILLSSSGGKIVMGSCVNGYTKYLLLDSSKDVTLVPVKNIEENKLIRACFFNRNKR